jgi:hypothetical protein
LPFPGHVPPAPVVQVVHFLVVLLGLTPASVDVVVVAAVNAPLLNPDTAYSMSSSEKLSPSSVRRGCGRSTKVTAICSIRFPSTSSTSKRSPS